MVVISPHLDDAAMSCGAWLAAHPGTPVLTVFAGTPADASLRTDWDTRCGFESAAQAMAARIAEDDRALGHLRALPRRLAFCDDQYGQPPAFEDLVAAIGSALDESDSGAAMCPLGLFHDDHRLVHAATLEAVRRRGMTDVIACEDVPYRAMQGLLHARLVALDRAGVRATPLPVAASPRDTRTKMRAVVAYRSQWRALGAQARIDVAMPERLWRLDWRD